MKNLYLLLLSGIALFSCEVSSGPPGIPGRDGLDGLDGLNGEEAFVFEYELSFTAPDYNVLLNLPDDFALLDSDVMLIYFLWEVDNDVEVWRALPQTLFFQEGILQYNYDFTKFDATVFLEGTINLDLLGSAYTDNWIARVVVVPGQFSGRTGIDYADYNQVKELFDLSPSRLVNGQYPTRPQ